MRKSLLLFAAAFLTAACFKPIQAAGSASAVQNARRLEDHAEDIIDVYLSGHADNAREKKLRGEMERALERLQSVADTGSSGARAAAVAEYLVGEMERCAGAGEFIRAALAANQVTLVMLPREAFPTARARRVALMDYLSREIVLLNRLARRSPAGVLDLRARRTAVEADWKQLRPWFLKQHHVSLVKAMDACVSTIMTRKSPPSQIRAGQTLGDLVDRLEQSLAK
ncbi:MAG: hypothetical protein P8Z49_05980 [Acidobacteriota bacterium]